ncbi:MAG: hypothetical protein ABIN74_00065 [Ferruginibacter sp.]
MWEPIRDCGKQLTIHSRVRERRDNAYRVYEIIEVEFDQYHLQLLSEGNKPTEDLRQVLNATQMLEYRFQVELKS